MEKIVSRILRRLDFLVRIEEKKVLGLGAEAILIRGIWNGYPVVIKYRYEKLYRDSNLDVILRRNRTSLEAKLLSRSLYIGVPVPTLLFVDSENGLLIMDYIKGHTLKNVIDNLHIDNLVKIFFLLGTYIGKLHMNGIIHGDITTSNILYLAEENRIYLIDFGLGEFSYKLEQQGVDIHLLLRALESTHPTLAPQLYDSFMRGYENIRGTKIAKDVSNKVLDIRKRGRYVAERRLKTVWRSREGAQ